MALTTDDLLRLFTEQHYERNSISADRRVQSDWLLRQLAARLDGRTLIELTPSDLLEWQGYEIKRGMAPSTVHKRQNMIRAFINWAYTAQLISFELSTQLKSVNGVRGAGLAHKPTPYKREEIERFREILAAKFPLMPPQGKKAGRGTRALNNYLRGVSPFNKYLRWHAIRLQYEAMVSLALEEGLRRIEIFNITVPELHHDNAGVVVQTAKSKPGQHREREVPWTAHSRECVHDWLEFRALLVPGHEHPWLALTRVDTSFEPMPFVQMEYAFRKFGPGWRWHRFRHTFATERLRAGVPLEQLQYMMGHAKLEQTLAYAEIVSADVRVEAERTEAAFERAVGVSA